ncbi:hypothetical protein KEM52_006364 [Ascosphaera acerosa]|nr:hypothetical protein KEM52_006364 [Ascosphaera acerosa]
MAIPSAVTVKTEEPEHGTAGAGAVQQASTPRKRGIEAGPCLSAAATPTPSPSPRKRQASSPTKQGSPSKSPSKSSSATSDAIDRILVAMKQQGSYSWEEIERAIERETGQAVKRQALQMRWLRQRRSLVVVEEADIPRLLASKKAVDASLERDRWCKIAAGVEQSGGGKYDGAVLQKKFKELVKQGLAVD